MTDEKLFEDLRTVNVSIKNLWENHPDVFKEELADKLEKAWWPFWQTMNRVRSANEGEDDDLKFHYYEIVNMRYKRENLP